MPGHFRWGSASVSGKLLVVQGLCSPTWLLHKILLILSPTITAPAESGAELEGEAAATEDVPGEAVGEPHPPQAAARLLPGCSVHPSGASGIPSASLPKSLVQRVSPKGLCCYGTIIYGLKLGSRWCFYIDHTGWIPARDLGVLFVFTCSLSDGNVSAGPPWS